MKSYKKYSYWNKVTYYRIRAEDKSLSINQRLYAQGYFDTLNKKYRGRTLLAQEDKLSSSDFIATKNEFYTYLRGFHKGLSDIIYGKALDLQSDSEEDP